MTKLCFCVLLLMIWFYKQYDFEIWLNPLYKNASLLTNRGIHDFLKKHPCI